LFAMTKQTVSSTVSEILDDMSFLHLAFRHGLVNCSSTARMIAPLVEERTGAKPGKDALIAAVRRYGKSLRGRKQNDLDAVISECNAILRTDLVGLHIKKWSNYQFMEGLSKMLTREVDWDAGEKVYLTQRSGEMYVCASAKFLPKLVALATKPPTELTHYQENLSLITIDHPPGGHNTPGVIAFFVNMLAQSNINLFEIFSTYRKFSFLVAEKDAARAYSVIGRAISQTRKALDQRQNGEEKKVGRQKKQ